MTYAGGGNRREREPGILVHPGRNQPLGAGCQLGTGNSRVSDNSHAQSMAEPRIKGAQVVVLGFFMIDVGSPR